MKQTAIAKIIYAACNSQLRHEDHNTASDCACNKSRGNAYEYQSAPPDGQPAAQEVIT